MERAFTLIELLVLIAIIAILASPTHFVPRIPDHRPLTADNWPLTTDWWQPTTNNRQNSFFKKSPCSIRVPL